MNNEERLRRFWEECLRIRPELRELTARFSEPWETRRQLYLCGKGYERTCYLRFHEDSSELSLDFYWKSVELFSFDPKDESVCVGLLSHWLLDKGSPDQFFLACPTHPRSPFTAYVDRELPKELEFPFSWEVRRARYQAFPQRRGEAMLRILEALCADGYQHVFQASSSTWVLILSRARHYLEWRKRHVWIEANAEGTALEFGFKSENEATFTAQPVALTPTLKTLLDQLAEDPIT